jgi:hypothetical protein
MNMNEQNDSTTNRIFARQIARELTTEDLDRVAGGSGDGTRSICCGKDYCADWDDSDEGDPICRLGFGEILGVQTANSSKSSRKLLFG